LGYAPSVFSPIVSEEEKKFTNINARTTSIPNVTARRLSTQRSDDNDETVNDDVDELLNLLQDLGDERENLLDVDEADGDAEVVDFTDVRRRRHDEQDELVSMLYFFLFVTDVAGN
jgi:hypothetical protein